MLVYSCSSFPSKARSLISQIQSAKEGKRLWNVNSLGVNISGISIITDCLFTGLISHTRSFILGQDLLFTQGTLVKINHQMLTQVHNQNLTQDERACSWLYHQKLLDKCSYLHTTSHFCACSQPSRSSPLTKWHILQSDKPERY